MPVDDQVWKCFLHLTVAGGYALKGIELTARDWDAVKTSIQNLAPRML
ncbi:hypothetical protein [Rhizobium mongolense]|uniref:Uncharacterized protein n=1 Tax=Rhizobium mongolense TaxID=57676 RepID=A0ABR6IG20_9HYPH|nr:hypothetical protein [Rhizobium mongolense]MBB4226593.1 hypothetical protein [Rhizobium mongolense]